MSFASLPGDVLLEVFTSLEFHSIVALRQTCRRCWVLSKMTAVWLDSFRWLTIDSKDWRALLPGSPTSHCNKHLESLVTRMVRFEVNWNKGHPRQIRYFKRPLGLVPRLIPGGRYFLCPIRYKDVTVAYYDFDNNATDEITRRELISYPDKSREIRAMDIAVDPLVAPLEFDLALELASEGKSIHLGENWAQ
ncbi:hypothetical protein M407DRAFT_21597 [Tulasnella calospora MUT 4182]|uniref:F-box domain-containing protein n=1 Tax=Tulasnella calospora MUT 4182 TaxID=1051891 RepID=A0A0C3M6D1_9AGAM|nr:hypothetical protein M407DRAFT_21597 [Tulasnella calospora MUT 4182]